MVTAIFVRNLTAAVTVRVAAARANVMEGLADGNETALTPCAVVLADRTTLHYSMRGQGLSAEPVADNGTDDSRRTTTIAVAD
jgi:hypothetical protein